MPRFAAVLCLGNDPLLLLTRCQVLATRFASVIGQSPESLPAALMRHFDLLVLCHSLRQQQCADAIHLFRARNQDAVVLAIQATTKGCNPDMVDASASALDGPLAMFRVIDNIGFSSAHRLHAGTDAARIQLP